MANRYGGLADFYFASSRLRERCGMKQYSPGVAVIDRGELVGSHSGGTYSRVDLNEALVLSVLGPSIPEAAFLFEK